MIKFIIWRLSQGFLVILGVIVTVFFIFHILPGDPLKMMAGNNPTPVIMNKLKKELHLDRPLYEQLAYYFNDISPVSVHKDSEKHQKEYNYTPILSLGKHVLVVKKPYFRRSFQTNRRVSETLIESLEGTTWLAVTSMIFATVFGVLLGLLAALRYNTWLDTTLVTTAVLGISAPSFISAILIAMIFGYYLSSFTGLDMVGYIWEQQNNGAGRELVLKNLILPMITLGIRPLAIITQLTRASVLEVLSQDYIRTAKAKGLSRLKVIFKHVLKNALNPVITAVTGWLASLMAGAFFVEYVFSWKGLGFTILEAINYRDFPVIMGGAIIIAMIFVFINILVDVLYAIIDPRVRLS